MPNLVNGVSDAEFLHGLGREVLRVERHDDLAATD